MWNCWGKFVARQDAKTGALDLRSPPLFQRSCQWSDQNVSGGTSVRTSPRSEIGLARAAILICSPSLNVNWGSLKTTIYFRNNVNVPLHRVPGFSNVPDPVSPRGDTT